MYRGWLFDPLRKKRLERLGNRAGTVVRWNNNAEGAYVSVHCGLACSKSGRCLASILRVITTPAPYPRPASTISTTTGQSEGTVTYTVTAKAAATPTPTMLRFRGRW